MTEHTPFSYAERHPEWHAEDSGHKARAVWSFVKRLGLTPARVVDVGCGAGGVTGRLRHVWPDIEGWDPSEVAIKMARTQHPECTFTRGHFEESGQHVDMVLCLDVVEHVQDDVRLLTALGQQADHLIFRVPLDWSLLDACRPQRLKATLDHWGHLRAYDRSLLCKQMVQAGLSVRSITYDRVPPGEPRSRLGHITGVLRDLGDTLHPRPFAWLLGGWSVLVYATSTTSQHPTR